MDTLTIVGCQFGDEGKGKIIDYLSCNYDLSVRFNGGENAGHTVVTDGNTIKYHLVPAGFLRARTSVIANGVVINLKKLNEEIDFLSKFRGNFDLKISNLAHIVTDLHIERDKYLENLRGEGSIGTTLKGIGPAYESKFGRYGIRLEDFRDTEILKEKMEFLSSIYNIPIKQGMIEDLIQNYERISKFITDTSEYLREEIDGGSSALFETAQGTFIDIEFGTYPFVTSSHTITGGVTVGTGLSPRYFSKFLGVAKAYTTRVGEGYFPTEMGGEDAERLRKLGNEYGATTGRPRRIGYLDIPMLRRSVKLNSLDYIALTKTDVLGKFKNIKVGVSYIKDGSDMKEYDPNIKVDKVEYVSFEPWENSRSNLNKFIEFIEDEIKVPVALLGSGEKREDIERRHLI
ncbi:MAG: adenylosuccinate synthase [Thermoplasmata archaeon]